MEIFEYVSVLTSIIIGLGIAHILRGVVGIIQHPRRHRPDLVHLVWAGFMFFQAIFFWWWEFKLEVIEVWSFGMYLFVLFYTFIIYLMCALLFPDDLEGYDGYRDYFMSRRGWFFGLLAAFFIIDFWDTLLKGAEHFASLGIEYPISSAVYVILSAIAIRSAKRRFHVGFALLGMAYQVYWAMRYYGELG